MRSVVLGILFVVGGAVPALAVDGVVEINQTCATQTGCVPSDSAGFPVSLPVGSYRLTSNLDLSVAPTPESTSGVLLATGATLDLNGFSIVGTTVCSGEPPGENLTCTPLGSGIGVGGGDRLTVMNGTIAGMGGRAVSCGRACVVSGLRVENNGGAGIVAADGSIVHSNAARRNGSNGIESISRGGLNIERNTIVQNGGQGITSASGDRIEGNVVRQNRGVGIAAGSDVVVRGNTCVENGSDGITGASGGRVTGNTANFNGARGMNLLDAAYDHNTVRANNLGSVSGGVDAGGNLCGGTLGCP